MPYTENPLTGPYAERLPLARAPLVKVLAQVRFNDVLKIKQEGFIADFQERLRRDYPDFSGEQTFALAIGPSGPQNVTPGKVWRFVNAEDNWRVSLEHNFVALETRAYVSRDEFMKRLREVLVAVSECFEPSFARRVGVRYVDRVEEPQFADLKDLVRSKMLGVVRSELHAHLSQAMSEAVFTTHEGKLSVRWGMLPPQGTYDPTTISPIDAPSWILDLDSYSEERSGFEVERLVSVAEGLARRAYTFFQWSVTEEFLTTYGADP